MLPIPRFFERDSGPYLTAGMICAHEPSTGYRNASYARIKPLGGNRGLTLMMEPGVVAPAGDPVAVKGVGAGASLFWAALGGAILGGLILNLMPCVFPILSLKALSLARSGGEARGARVEALAYTAGAIMTSFLLGGALLALRAVGEDVVGDLGLEGPHGQVRDIGEVVVERLPGHPCLARQTGDRHPVQ